MGHVAVTVPAGFAFAALGHHIVNAASLDKLLIELGVATNAVVHDHLCAHVFCHDSLTLGMGDKISHMLHAIHRLETIFGHQTGVGHMAVVTSGISAMRRMAPRSIVGCHDVAIDTGGGVVGNIGMSPEQIHKQPS